jgi:hypothetical protein
MQRKNREITNDLRKLGEEMDALRLEIVHLMKLNQDIRAICNELISVSSRRDPLGRLSQ